MKLLITLLKPFSFAPAIIMMLLIYSFSAQNAETSGQLSYKVSYKLVEIKNEVLHEGKDSYTLSQEASGIEYYVRKAAHMTEYFILAITISFPFYVYGLRGFALLVVAGIICIGFAGLDEYHQSFVEGRGPGIKDVGFDSLGAFLGILLVQSFCWSILHNPNVKKKKRKHS